MAVIKRCKTPRGGGSAAGLVYYVLAEELTQKVSHQLPNDPIHKSQHQRLKEILAGASARLDGGVNTIFSPVEGDGMRPSSIYARGVNTLYTAATDMQVVADVSRCKSPVVHFVVSFNEQESRTLTDEQVIRFAESTIDDAGYKGHAAVFAVHRDTLANDGTGNLHVHIAMCAVNKETLRPAIRQGDYLRLHRAIRENEIKFGFDNDFGMYVVKDRGLPTQRIVRANTKDWEARKQSRADERLSERVMAFVSDEEGLETPSMRRDRLVFALRDYFERCDERREIPLRADIHVIAARLACKVEGVGEDSVRFRLMERAAPGEIPSASFRDSFGDTHARWNNWKPTETVLTIPTKWAAPSPLDDALSTQPRLVAADAQAKARRSWLIDIGNVERSEAELRSLLAEDPGRVARDIVAGGQATFTDEDVDRWVSARITDDWQPLADNVLQSDQSILVLSPDPEFALYTTAEQRKLTEEVSELALELAQLEDPLFDAAALEQAISDEESALGIKFSDEQRAVFDLLRFRFSVVQGESGAGKTVIMSVQRRYCELTGRDIAGFATAQLAAEGLGKKARIAAVNQARARAIEAATGAHMILPESRIILDELSMFSLQAARAMLQRMKAQGASGMFIGDLAQLSNIEAGDTMRVLAIVAQKTHRLAKLTKTFRQTGAAVRWMQDAVPLGGSAIRRRDAEAFREYLLQYVENGHIVFHKDRPSEIAAKAQDLIDATRQGLRVLAPGKSRQDCFYTNVAVLEGLGLRGTGKEFRFEQGLREMAPGARIVFERNAEKKLGVLNGYTGTVRAVTQDQKSLRWSVQVELDSGKVISFDPSRYKQVDYGWAVTTHKSQGQGTPLVIPTLSRNDDARSAHVALTRCEELLRVHTRLSPEELIEHLTSKKALQLKDDALYFEHVIRETGGKYTLLAKAVQRAAESDSDPLKQRWRAEMGERINALGREIVNVTDRFEAKFAVAVNKKKRADLAKAKDDALESAYRAYPLDSFYSWVTKERDRLEEEYANMQTREMRPANDAEKIRSVNIVIPRPDQARSLATALQNTVPVIDTPGEQYLRGRGITASSGILYSPNWYQDVVKADGEPSLGVGPAVVFPVRDRAGEVVAAQGRLIRPIPRDDMAPLKQVNIGPTGLGVYATAGALDAHTIGLAEAPIDALSLAERGLPSIALCGSTNFPEWLPQALIARELIIATDLDKAGRISGLRALREYYRDTTCAWLTFPGMDKTDQVDPVKFFSNSIQKDDVNAFLLRDPAGLDAAIDQARIDALSTMQRAWRKAWRVQFDREPPVGVERWQEYEKTGKTLLAKAQKIMEADEALKRFRGQKLHL